MNSKIAGIVVSFIFFVGSICGGIPLGTMLIGIISENIDPKTIEVPTLADVTDVRVNIVSSSYGPSVHLDDVSDNVSLEKFVGDIKAERWLFHDISITTIEFVRASPYGLRKYLFDTAPEANLLVSIKNPVRFDGNNIVVQYEKDGPRTLAAIGLFILCAVCGVTSLCYLTRYSFQFVRQVRTG